jgi:hypothetical protein
LIRLFAPQFIQKCSHSFGLDSSADDSTPFDLYWKISALQVQTSPCQRVYLNFLSSLHPIPSKLILQIRILRLPSGFLLGRSDQWFPFIGRLVSSLILFLVGFVLNKGLIAILIVLRLYDSVLSTLLVGFWVTDFFFKNKLHTLLIHYDF